MRQTKRELALAVVLVVLLTSVAAALLYLSVGGKGGEQSEAAGKITTREQAFALARLEAKRRGVDLEQYRLAFVDSGPEGWLFRGR